MKQWFVGWVKITELVAFANKHKLLPGEILVLSHDQHSAINAKVMYYAEKELF